MQSVILGHGDSHVFVLSYTGMAILLMVHWSFYEVAGANISDQLVATKGGSLPPESCCLPLDHVRATDYNLEV